jgi:dTDP-4-dehydrorhamnose 3,5-epimerase
MEALDIEGAWVLTPRIHSDERGSFLEWLREAEFHEAVGYRVDVAQANCSVSRRGSSAAFTSAMSRPARRNT